MIRLVDRTNRRRFSGLMEKLFRFRHDVFVKERGWTEFDRGGLYETDQFDTNDTAYVIAVDESDTVVGCCRMYPTQLPHMLSEVFPFLVQGEVPRRRDLYELTRFGVSKHRRGTSTYSELLAGFQEYCLEHGATGATSVIRTFRMPLLQAAGMSIVPLGLPQTYQDEQLIAVTFEVSEDILDRVHRYANLQARTSAADFTLQRKTA